MDNTSMHQRLQRPHPGQRLGPGLLATTPDCARDCFAAQKYVKFSLLLDREFQNGFLL